MAAEIPPQRWERRERKKQAARDRMKKSGMSVRLLHQIIGQRAAEAKAKAERKAGGLSGTDSSPFKPKRLL